MRKKFLILLLVAMIMVSVAACGNNNADSNQDEANNSENTNNTANNDEGNDEEKESITINVSTRFGTDVPDEVYYRDQVESFSEMDNGIIVEMDNIPTESDYLDKLRTSFASGDSPNAFIEYGGSRTLDYIESDALVNFQPYFDEDPDWYSTFYPSTFGDLIYEGYEGVWGTPFKAYAVSLYYNKDIFEAQGLTPPASWDDLLDVCESLKEAGINPFQAGEKDVWRFGHLHNNIVVKTLGREGVEALAERTLAYDSEVMIGTYQKIIDLYENGYLGTDVLNTDYNTEKSVFAAGECAMRWDGSWYISEIFGTDNYENVGAVAFPYINEEYADQAQGGASDMWFASKLKKSDEEIAASIEFLKYITSQEYTAGNNEVASVLYPIDFTPTAATPENPLLDEVKDLVAGYSQMSTDIQNIDPESHMLDTVRNALQGLAMGNSAEECAAQIVERIQVTE